MARACTPWYPTVFPEKCDGCAPFDKPRCVEYCQTAYSNSEMVRQL
ncbi:MAG: hypothetical protein QXW82_07625 [Candidatus Bathyarchaeia archaeon]